MLKWIAVVLVVLLQSAAHAGALEECTQDQDAEQRIRACTERIRQFPGDATAFFNRGSAYLSQGELDRAIADHTRVIQLDGWYGAAYLNRGLAYERKEQFERAVADYGKAIEINPRHAAAYAARASVYVKTGQAALALSDAERAVDLEPFEAGFLDTRAHVYEALGRTQDAIADYRQALARNPAMQSAIEGLRRLRASPSSQTAFPR